MKFTIGLLTLTLLLLSELSGQALYFQQSADYTISATLDTAQRELVVDCNIGYTNNSPDIISEIYFHLWWNAFSDKRSAFADQQLEMGETDFYFAKEKDLGGYSNILMSQDNAELNYQNHVDGSKTHKDIVQVSLAQPIKNGESSEIRIKYRLKIPKSFSRGGFDGDLFRMTQWYPKPAVYDTEGWHPMPYLEMGEYYSEFGSYQVNIKVPKGYNVVGTGTHDVSLSDSFTEYQFSAEKVHDFAWFASDNYKLESKTVDINGEQKSLSIFSNGEYESDKIFDFIARGLDYYSDHVGQYPYPQMTMVWNQKGGMGMEYPMITMIDFDGDDQSLDHLIAHEIGHNWFYGILASNERRYPWMDEGINSYIDHLYNDEYYDSHVYESSLPPNLKGVKPEYPVLRHGCRHLMCINRDQKINTPSDEMDMLNYGANSYERMTMNYDYLANYLGNDVFADAIKKYYQEWGFKHPQPADWQAVLESETGKDLEWFFEDVINSTKKLDIKVKNAEQSSEGLMVSMHNKGSLNIPIHISGYDIDNKLIYNEWVEPFTDTKDFIIPNKEYWRITANGALPYIDVNRRNNHFWPTRLLKKIPKKALSFGQQQRNSTKTRTFVLPSVLYNTSDGVMLGTHIMNGYYPLNDYRIHINPNYAIGSNSLSGTFHAEKDFFPKNSNKIRKWTLGAYGRKFNYTDDLNYTKLDPFIRIHLDKGSRSSRYLQYKYIIVNREVSNFIENEIDTQTDNIHQLTFESTYKKRLSNNNLLVQLEYEQYDSPFEDSDGESYLKLSTSYSKNVSISNKRKFRMRLFGGYFLHNSRRESSSFSNVFTKGSFALAQQGFTDHTFDGYYLDRVGTSGFLSRQIDISEGGFKNAINSQFSFGQSNDYMLSTNLSIDGIKTILGIKVDPYWDMAYVSTKSFDNQELTGEFIFSGGVSVGWRNFFSVYVPLVNSSIIDQNYAGFDFGERISFKLNLNKLNLWKLLDNPGSIL